MVRKYSQLADTFLIMILEDGGDSSGWFINISLLGYFKVLIAILKSDRDIDVKEWFLNHIP